MTYLEVIANNLEEIVSMKMQASANEFVFLSKDGEIKYGDKNQYYGQNILHAFGGGERSRSEAISDLEFMIQSEPEY